MRPDGTDTIEPSTLGEKWKPEDLVVALTLLIIEGRTPELSPKGRAEGPHCPAGTLLPGSGHTCLPGHQQCERARALGERARLLWRNAVPVMVELGLRVSCCAGRDDPPSGPEGSDSELGLSRGALLLERWALRSIPKRAGDALMGDKALLQAIRSYVHFSQLSAWLSAVQGNLSYTIFYRVCAPGESLVSDFEHSPVEHSFPTTASTPGCTLRVSVSALPYLPGLPTIYCSLHASLHLDTSGPTSNASPGPSSPATSISVSSSDVRTQVSFETGAIDAEQNLRVPSKVVLEYIRPHLLNCENSSPVDHPRDYSEENDVSTREMPVEQQPRCHMPGRRPSGRTLKLTLGTNPDRSTSHTSPLASLLQGREVIANIAERLALCDLDSSHLSDSQPPLASAGKLSALSELKQTVRDPFGAVCKSQHTEVQSTTDKTTPRVAELSSCRGHETPIGIGSVFSRHRPTKLRVKRKLLPSPAKVKVTEEEDRLESYVFDGDKEEEEDEEASPDDDDPCHSPPAKCSVPPALGCRIDGSRALRGTTKLTRVGLPRQPVHPAKVAEVPSWSKSTGSLLLGQKRTLHSACLPPTFHPHTGLPSSSSPAPERRSKKGCFDVDASLLQNNGHIKQVNILPPFPITKFLSREAWKERDGASARASSHPVSSHNLLGTFEESVLNLRLPVMGTVSGFLAQLGASGAFCPSHVSLPVHVYFFHIADDGSPSPYLGILSLRPLGYRGYHVPRAGTIQVTLFNPNKTVVKMFVVMYNLRDMPPNHQTFLRQRTFSVPVARQTGMALVGTERALPPTKTGLRYLVHLRFVSSKSGKIYLHRDIRLLFSRKSTEIDSGVAYELKSYTEMPQNPRFSPRG
uniref:atos homolog protein A isoform X2 n=1 Tax=Myxine glutinosa TaxID=7769 RepID=UPI00358F5F5D